MKSLVADKQTYHVSVSSDGSVRAAFASITGLMKPQPLEAAMELFQVVSLEKTINSGREGESASVTVSCERNCFDAPQPSESIVPCNAAAMHAIDSTLLMRDRPIDNRQSGCYHVLAYGGASGLLRVHSINPLKLTFRR